MLDTNIASYIIKNTYPTLLTHLRQVPMTKICISTITESELLFGLAKRGDPLALKTAVH
jgi:tRNA(fMet)-specific endonuclease VapC